MARMKRREFFATAGAAAGAATMLGLRMDAAAAEGGVQPPVKLPAGRRAKVEFMFKAPGPKANGLQATPDGLWIMDQGDNHVYLVNYEGKVLRNLETEANRASGITFDGQHLWLASTYSREIIRCDATTGKTVEKYFTPGAGVIYRMPHDVPARRSPLAPAAAADPPAARQPGQSAAEAASGPNAPRLGTGGHGLEFQNGKLWLAVPPARTIYRIDPATWVVEHRIPSVGNRPHGIGFEGRFLWEADSNLNAFFKRNPDTGEVLDRIQLADSDPLPHGMTVRDGFIWYCDDVDRAPVSRVRIAGGTSSV